MAMSIRVVTIFTRGFVKRRTSNATSPTRTLRPNVKAVTSRMISRTGWLFQSSVVPGRSHALRCPRKSTSIPKWKGTAPQNRVSPSRNCEDRAENLKPVCLYR
jgi:hypothetical protein